MKVVVYLFIAVFLTSFTFAATIHGTIYDISLDEAKDVRIEINTEPKQQYIAKDGIYSFEVPPGDYSVEAKYYVFELLESSAVENISVRSDGSFVLDLILFPVIDSELISDVEDISFEDDYFEEKPNYSFIVSVIVFLIFLVAYFLFKGRKDKSTGKVAQKETEEISKKEVEEVAQKEAAVESVDKGEDYYEKVLSIIRENKRVTQKEIRNQVPLSEGKISLIITELEHKGIVEKIKKGRGNVIILKE